MAMQEHNGLHDEPLGELLRRLSNQVTELARQEIELAKAELAEKGKQAGIGAGLLVGAGLVAVLGLGALTAFLIMAIDGAIPNWAAALIVGGALLAVAAVLALVGRDRLREAAPPLPEETIETTKEDIQWAKTQLQSGRR
jgi:uncharacterized membrane protein YqjE